MAQVPFQRGESAVVVPVPQAEPLVSSWRARFDISAAYGVPAHVTVIYPFLYESLLNAAVLQEMTTLCAAMQPFEVTFNRVGRFPGVAYLAPEPERRFRDLTARFVERWPEALPYGGKGEDPVPHVTVADKVTPEVLDMVEEDLQPRLPLTATATELVLYVFGERVWEVRARLAFRDGSHQA